MAKVFPIVVIAVVGMSLTPLSALSSMAELSNEVAEAIYQDGTLISPEAPATIPVRQPVVVDSFPSFAPNYSMGLTFNGTFLWNDEAFSHWFAKMDTSDGSLVAAYTPTAGNRDMGWDGNWLWATDWGTQTIYKYDPSNCSIVYSFFHPFSGRPDGVTWDGEYLWIGEEGGQIWQIDTLGNIVRSIPSPQISDFNPRGLAWDGAYLWVGCQSIGLIYQIDPADGTVILFFSAPSGPLQQGLAFDGRYLWSTGGDNWIYKIDIGLGVEEMPARPERSRADARLLHNYPNPFTHSTTISFQVSSREGQKGRGEDLLAGQLINLSVYDMCGRLIRTLLDASSNEQTIQPSNQVCWDGTNSSGHRVPAGVYFCRLTTGDTAATKKLILLR